MIVLMTPLRIIFSLFFIKSNEHVGGTERLQLWHMEALNKLRLDWRHVVWIAQILVFYGSMWLMEPQKKRKRYPVLNTKCQVRIANIFLWTISGTLTPGGDVQGTWWGNTENRFIKRKWVKGSYLKLCCAFRKFFKKCCPEAFQVWSRLVFS